MTIRTIGALIAAAGCFVLALLVVLAPLDVPPADPAIRPAVIPFPCPQGGTRC